MNRTSIIAAFFALVLIAGHSALAQSGYDLFQKGLVAERTEGNLEEAIRLYKQIVDQHKDDRALVAKALVQMGGCYEKMGRAEARKAYERVVNEFTDQPEPVRVAREHLEQFDAGTLGAAGNGPTYRLVLSDKLAGLHVGTRDLSPSGDRIVFEHEKKLYITDQAATATRMLLDEPPWLLRYPTWSPDGRMIVCTGSKEGPGKQEVYTIFVVSSEGGPSRQVGPVSRHWRRGRWTHDSKHLTYREADGLHTVTLDGNEVRFIPKDDLPFEIEEMLWGAHPYSPNGRWLACCGQAAEDARDICILPAKGGQAQRLTGLPQISHSPVWSPDSRTLYFISRESASRNIWSLAMDPETGLQKGEPRQVTFFKDTDIRWPKVLGNGERMTFNIRKSTTSIYVADSSSPQESRPVAAGLWPQLSPDGQTVYYMDEDNCLVALPLSGGTARQLVEIPLERSNRPYFPKPVLSPDGQTLAYATKLEDGFGLFTVPVAGGEPELLASISSKSEGVRPTWSPDSSELAYATNDGLYIIGATGGKSRKVDLLQKESDFRWNWQSIRWSPDGKFLSGQRRGGDSGNIKDKLFVVPASGGKLQELATDDGFRKMGLEWHPERQQLTYCSRRFPSETRQVYLDGRPSTLLVNVLVARDGRGWWAPDGHRFFFKGYVRTGLEWCLYVYDESSGETSLVSSHFTLLDRPCWSRDGKTMAWWATRSTNYQVWVMENFLPASPATQLLNPPTGNYFVTQSGDDAEEWGEGNMYLDSSDIELVHDDNRRGDQVVGIRFADIRIPKGAQIKKAYVQFTTDEVSTKPTDLTIHAELASNAEVFTTAQHNISSRKRTKASVKWSPEPWNVAYERIEKQQTPGLSSLIQEVVDQPGWRQGNVLVLIISGSGKRSAISFDNSGQHYAPMLHIDY